MSLFRYIVRGFGWQLGARAADEALEELDAKLPKQDEQPQSAPPPPGVVKRWAMALEAKRAERRRRADAARAAREIEDELEALKRKLDD